MSPQEIVNARRLIANMPLNEVMELKEIYGASWSNISSPTTFGKDFKKEYDAGSFSNLKWHGVKPNGPNHERYERIN
jgi:hypothetical protein